MRARSVAVVPLALLAAGGLTTVGMLATGRNAEATTPAISATFKMVKNSTGAEFQVNNTGNKPITLVAFLPYGGWKIGVGSGCRLVTPGMVCNISKYPFTARSGGSFDFKISGTLGGGYAWIKGTTGRFGPTPVAGPNGKLRALPSTSKNAVLGNWAKSVGLWVE